MATKAGVLFVVACLLCQGAYSSRMAPIFSWHTLPVFFHTANKTGPFSEDMIEFIASHFSIATIEKFQGACANSKSPVPTPSCKQEAVIEEELRRIKLANPLVCTVLYYNSVIDFPQYSVHQRLLDNTSLMLHNSTGDVVKISCPSPTQTCDIFDLGNPETQALFMDVCMNATKSGYVDGCFLDRAQQLGNVYHMDPATAARYAAGHSSTFPKLQALLAPGPLIANTGFGLIGAPSFPGFYMVEFFTACQNSISQLLQITKKGLGALVHGSRGDESEMAAFLIGAGYNSFFGIGGWGSADTEAVLRTQHWRPQFKLALGEPYGDAELNNGVWQRRFVHVNVTFDTRSKTGRIQGWPFKGGALANWNRPVHKTALKTTRVGTMTSESSKLKFAPAADDVLEAVW